MNGGGGGAEGAGGAWTGLRPVSRLLRSLCVECTLTLDTPCVVSPIDPLYGSINPALERCRCGCTPGDSESGVRMALALLDREIQHLHEYRDQQAESEAHTSIMGGPREARGTQKIISRHLIILASQLTVPDLDPCSQG
jgi:hypothetical protein